MLPYGDLLCSHKINAHYKNSKCFFSMEYNEKFLVSKYASNYINTSQFWTQQRFIR
uniref:Uncharacterized protein n=1 Tax=Arundo donax TaxID=35708 RepID=A0A0A9FF24_ARUDO